MDANRSSANAAKRVRIRRSCVGVTGYHQRRWRTPFQLRGYHFTGTPSSSTFARPNGVLLGTCARPSGPAGCHGPATAGGAVWQAPGARQLDLHERGEGHRLVVEVAATFGGRGDFPVGVEPDQAAGGWQAVQDRLDLLLGPLAEHQAAADSADRDRQAPVAGGLA